MKKQKSSAVNSSPPHFYSSDDSMKIVSFVQIPKLLFTDSRYRGLPLMSKIAYSLYLARYSNTKYRDGIGPYIIFTDEEMSHFLDTTAEYVKTVRKYLEKAELIECRRGTSVNKIYLYSYAKDQPGSDSDRTFFYESQLDTWQFYRFPRELFEEKYINLPLYAKFLYSMYFDMLCLSKANRLADSMERIYFTEGLQTQEIRACISRKTIQKYRGYLKATGLLFEYRPFGEDIRYYLLKTDMYEDNVFKYENMTALERSEFLSSISEDFRQRFMVQRDADDVRALRETIKKSRLTVKYVAARYTAATGKSLSVGGLRKYLNGTRRMPEEVKSFIEEMVQSDPAIGNIYAVARSREAARKSGNMSPANAKKTTVQKSANVTSINDTENNNTENKNTVFDNYINSDAKIKKEIQEKNILFIERMKNGSLYLTDIDISFIEDSLNNLTSQDSVSFSSGSYESKDILNSLDSLLKMNDKAEMTIIEILNSMASADFSTPRAQIRYFQASLLSRLAYRREWFEDKVRITELQKYLSRSYPRDATDVPDEIKNYSWWESES